MYEYGSGRGLTTGTGTVGTSFALGPDNSGPQGIADPMAFVGESSLDVQTSEVELIGLHPIHFLDMAA